MGSACSDVSGDAGHDAHCLRAWRGTRARHAVSVDMSGGAQGRARRVRVPQPGHGNGSSLLSARPRPTSSAYASGAHACEYLRSAGAANMWATRVAQMRSGDQCQGYGQCVANVAHVAHAWVVRGGGANRVDAEKACLTRYVSTRVNPIDSRIAKTRFCPPPTPRSASASGRDYGIHKLVLCVHYNGVFIPYIRGGHTN